MHSKGRHSHQLVADGIAETVLLKWTVSKNWILETKFDIGNIFFILETSL